MPIAIGRRAPGRKGHEGQDDKEQSSPKGGGRQPRRVALDPPQGGPQSSHEGDEAQHPEQLQVRPDPDPYGDRTRDSLGEVFLVPAAGGAEAESDERQHHMHNAGCGAQP